MVRGTNLCEGDSPEHRSALNAYTYWEADRVFQNKEKYATERVSRVQNRISLKKAGLEPGTEIQHHQD